MLAHPMVIATPHTAGVTAESRERIGRMAAEAFCAVARGDLPPRLVNPEVTASWLARRDAVLSRPR